MNAKQAKKARKQIAKEIRKQMTGWRDEVKKLGFIARVQLAFNIIFRIKNKKSKVSIG